MNYHNRLFNVSGRARTRLIMRAFLFHALLAVVALISVAPSSMAQNEPQGKFKRTPRDPFTRVKPIKVRPRTRPAPPVPTIVQPPPVQTRIDQYRERKAAAMSAGQPAPKPTTALTLSEIQVVGIFRTPRGMAAMVEAVPIKLSYVVYPGESFFDGQLVAIEENRLVFRRQVSWSDGRREVVIDTKILRKPNTVVDPLPTTSAEPPSGGTSTP